MVLICISPLSDDGGHLSMCLFDIRIFSVIQCLFKIFPILEELVFVLITEFGRGLVFVSIQPVFVFCLGHSTHLHLR